ncbi:GumC family protein [Cohaesibacter celericrescens]|uniref:non-specific protein-tyrosine kinase n=1 Tax=Cohaesibacter celericrescens TaxID=2067669 RepID=A0A2N5XNJ1_9HYPH|nr:Wzz/FepE/Etk N-terminal domain-containing protein [Cohaesibacter celericrescens]PLW76052.1 hypothetical protein C0081_16655 [Cohaesibacter celericrescens]
MDDSEFDIRHLVGMIGRQRKLIVSTVILAVALAVIALFAITPKYTASALILVDPSQKNLLDPRAASGFSNTDSARVDSEVAIVASDRVLVDVVRSQNLISDDEFGVKLGIKDKLLTLIRVSDGKLPSGEEAVLTVLQKFKESVRVSRKGLTYLIAVSVQSIDKGKASRLANAISEAYIHNQIEAKVDNARAARDIVMREVSQAQEAIIAADRNYEQFLNENKDSILAASGSDDLKIAFAEIENLTALQSVRSQSLASLNDNLGSQNWDAILSELQSVAVEELVKQRNELSRRLQNTDANSSSAGNIADQLKNLDRQLESETRKTISFLTEQNALDLKRLKSVKGELDATINQSNLPTDILAQVYGLRQTSSLATTQYRTLLSRSQSLETEQALQVADSRVVSASFPPTEPSSPNSGLILSFALAGGLGLGLAAAFLFEYFIGGFISEEQVEDITKLPVATTIMAETLDSNSTSLSDILITSPLSRYTENFRRLQVAIHSSFLDREARKNEQQRCFVTLVTSTLPSEGKSTVALSLARSYALSNKRVLIIDCDMRKPNLHKQLNKTTPKGIDDFLSGSLTTDILSSIVTTDDKTPLTAILGSRAVGRPTDQLVSKTALTRLIEIASQRFDHIIIDSPPVEPVVDALYLAEKADTIVYVIRWAKTSSRLARKAIAMLEKVKRPTTNIFAVLNQKEGGEHYYYSNYSGYYRDEET